MFQYYQILLAVNIPNPVLTYKILDSQDNFDVNSHLAQGQLVEVPVRGRTVYGIVLEVVDSKKISYDIDKVQLISSTYSYILPETSLKLIRIFNLATFNNAGLILETILNPFLNLADKHRASILEYHQHIKKQVIRNTTTKKADKIEEKPTISVLGNYDFDISIPSRIMYLIRIYNQIQEQHRTKTADLTSSTILIVCPEVKMLTHLYNDIKAIIMPQDNIDLFQFTSSTNQNNRKLIIDVMSQWNLNTTNGNKRVIFTTRAGLFLPFGSLDKVIIVDEANNMYYQASNSLYYDTRELVLWIQRAYQCSVDFVSNFPSIRLRNFDNKTPAETIMSKSLDIYSKPINIDLSHYDSKMTQNQIFGPQIEAVLNDEIGNVME